MTYISDDLPVCGVGRTATRLRATKSMCARVVLIMLSVLLAASPRASDVLAQAASEVAPSRDVVLMPGDVVRVTVWRIPEISGEFVVGANGTILEPFYMDVVVGGLPFSVAERRIRTHIEQFENSPKVLVEPLVRLTVGGEVRQPNIYSVPPETSVYQAIILAGGHSPQGRRDRIRLLRDGRDSELSIAQAHNQSVQSGDRILIDRRHNVFREVIVPTVTVAGALASIIRLLYRL
jgi:polysaccharide biosynthesis/export protein